MAAFDKLYNIKISAQRVLERNGLPGQISRPAKRRLAACDIAQDVRRSDTAILSHSLQL